MRFKFRPQQAWDDDAAVADAAVERVMVLGDIHNNRQALDAALRTAADEDCDVLVQVGDFWLQDSGWNRFAPEYAGAMSTAVHAAMPVVVIDGNHEVWPCLTQFQRRDDTSAARANNRPLHLGGSLWWADRGSVWTWAGRRFGALGGTVSPDKWIPAVARHRWDEEAITQHDLDRLIGNTPDGLDVLICHDAPEGTSGLVSGLPWDMPTGLQRRADDMRTMLRSAVDATSPELVFHGHWHQQNRCHLNNGSTEVIGLAAAGHPPSAAVLSISDLTADYVNVLQRPRSAKPPAGTDT